MRPTNIFHSYVVHHYPEYSLQNTVHIVFAGIVFCLAFNVIAVSVCWIRGGGELLLFRPYKLLNSKKDYVTGFHLVKSFFLEKVHYLQVLKYFSLLLFMHFLDALFRTCCGTGHSIARWGMLLYHESLEFPMYFLLFLRVFSICCYLRNAFFLYPDYTHKEIKHFFRRRVMFYQIHINKKVCISLWIRCRITICKKENGNHISSILASVNLSHKSWTAAHDCNTKSKELSN